MSINQNIDIVDRAILDIISHYDEGISSLDLWYEIGEQDSPRQYSITRHEIVNKLESLSRHGYVECTTSSENIERWILKN